MLSSLGPGRFLDGRLGGPQGRSGHLREEKNVLSILGFGPRAVNSVAEWIRYRLSVLE
jgi:hypothetical protein